MGEFNEDTVILQANISSDLLPKTNARGKRVNRDDPLRETLPVDELTINTKIG